MMDFITNLFAGFDFEAVITGLIKLVTELIGGLGV